MIRLGIDYGTTNTVVVCSDRGRYPVIPHSSETSIGSVSREIFPSLAVRNLETGEFMFGFEAEACLYRPDADKRYEAIRSPKRFINDYVEGKLLGQETVKGGFSPEKLLIGFAQTLRTSITKSGLLQANDELETVLTWPANANGAQRYLTRRCFSEAGFKVIDAINEPTAAAIEFADRIAMGNHIEARQLTMSVAVFDLGGGTFDVSLVKIEGTEFTVIGSLSIEKLGGDDFDELLANMFADKLKINLQAMPPFKKMLLMMLTRQLKESIGTGPGTSLTITPRDIGLDNKPCTVSTEAYFKELKTLLKPAIDKLQELLESNAAHEAQITPDTLNAIYLVGGSSKLPPVHGMIAERFPNARIVMSDKPFTSTAMGAAIHSSNKVRLHDVLSRTFGALRLADSGTREIFSPVFPAGTRLPERGQPALVHVIEYEPHHNIGHLRYLECVAINRAGWPSDGVRFWSDVLFPYDPIIPVGSQLQRNQIVARKDLSNTKIREEYFCDADGVLTTSITRCCDGQSCTYEIFRKGE